MPEICGQLNLEKYAFEVPPEISETQHIENQNITENSTTT